ncbi:MAG: sugar transferase [Caldilineaceae bacterium]
MDAKPFRILSNSAPCARTLNSKDPVGPPPTTHAAPNSDRLCAASTSTSWLQLINVFMGDMSLVGPRLERPVYVEQFRQQIPRYMDRHREKAGMTGWAQVNGMRGDTSIAERTKYDLWYIENWSLALDIKIIIRTIVQTIVGNDRNAY